MASNKSIPEEPLTAEEWALAIVIAYESGRSLTEEGEKELTREITNPKLREQVRTILIKEGYGDVFGLSKLTS